MGKVTELIHQIGNSKNEPPVVSTELFSLVYKELRAIAARNMAKEDCGHTLQPTALVNEAYLRLASSQIEWQDRGHFFSVAARAMRRILIDAARERKQLKRGRGWGRLPLSDSAVSTFDVQPDLVRLDEALNALELASPEKAELVRLHFFGGLTIAQCAEILEVSKSTAERSWRFSRAWLRNYMSQSCKDQDYPKNAEKAVTG